jgi:3-hydroxyacyl-CoA dehydrogenase
MGKLTKIGCGTMGHSIALNAEIAEIQVKMYGIDEVCSMWKSGYSQKPHNFVRTWFYAIT